MNPSQPQSAPSGQTNPKTIHDLHQAFASLAFSYGMVNHDTNNDLPTGSALVCLEMDCEKLVMIAQAMRQQDKGGAI